MKRRSVWGEYGGEKRWMLRGRREGDQAGEDEEEGREIQGGRREKTHNRRSIPPPSCLALQRRGGAPLVAEVAELVWLF